MSKKSKAAKKKLALKKRRRKEFKTFIVCLIVLAAIAALARLVVFDTVKMNSDAMSPVYQAGDTVFVNKLTLWKSFDIERGDRVYAVLDGDMKLIRTVYGLPGDLIDVREDGTYLVSEDGEKLITGNEVLNHGTIPEGTFLLLNENLSDNSPDGRTLGLTRSAQISGIPGDIIWPPKRAFTK